MIQLDKTDSLRSGREYYFLGLSHCLFHIILAVNDSFTRLDKVALFFWLGLGAVQLVSPLPSPAANIYLMPTYIYLSPPNILMRSWRNFGPVAFFSFLAGSTSANQEDEDAREEIKKRATILSDLPGTASVTSESPSTSAAVASVGKSTEAA